ncbi:MAG: energy-coupling factor transporter transmembrane protein EcfT [Treponema sp.]|jgi:energy-coupling factor transport system permease protein|nr:energy-coupling factor transporter transmembrane protein EcfT [Treponema sp.]
MNGLLDYVPGNSFLHRLNPFTKLVLSFVLCAACFISDRHFFIAGIIVLSLLMSAAGGAIGRSLRILVSLVKLCCVLFIAQVFFVRKGAILLHLPLNIYITAEGLLFSLLFVLRLTAAALPLALMLSVTRMSDISNVLTRYFGIPYKYTFALTTAMRFIPLFSREAADVMEAQTARGVEFDTKNFFKKIMLLLPLCVPLLISSVRRIEGLAISVELRGFSLRGRRSGYKRYRFGAGDAAAFAVCALAAAGAVIL